MNTTVFYSFYYQRLILKPRQQIKKGANQTMIYTVSVTLETGSIKGSFLGIVNIWTHVSTLRANQTFNHGLTKFMGIDFLQI